MLLVTPQSSAHLQIVILENPPGKWRRNAAFLCWRQQLKCLRRKNVYPVWRHFRFLWDRPIIVHNNHTYRSKVSGPWYACLSLRRLHQETDTRRTVSTWFRSPDRVKLGSISTAMKVVARVSVNKVSEDTSLIQKKFSDSFALLGHHEYIINV